MKYEKFSAKWNAKKNSGFLLHQYDFYIFLHERFPFVPFLHSYVQMN